jgi:hypothetical protein
MPITGIDEMLKEIRDSIDGLERDGITAVKDAARVVTQELMDRTPVWSGKTCGSYAWGINGPGSFNYAGGPVSKQEQTNKMPLPGGESNRGPAEDAAMAALEGELPGFTALGLSMVVTNTSPIWDLVDSGSAPTPEHARNPGGVSALAEQSAKEKLGANFK